jgi:hypothetical protein
MGGHVAALDGKTIALLEQYVSIWPDQDRAERMVSAGPGTRRNRESGSQINDVVGHHGVADRAECIAPQIRSALIGVDRTARRSHRVSRWPRPAGAGVGAAAAMNDRLPERGEP